jgi:murein DD-endopeptidase MepM/ murein hydrolase activator NlpD
MVTLYAHLSRIDVRSGQALRAGERLGLVGTSGYSTGPHLHLEVRRNGRPIDPLRVLGRRFQVAVED